MSSGPYNVLFLCTGNSARSVLAEALLNEMGGGRFTAFSAGSQPKGVVHAMALEVLAERGIATGELHSKSWSEFGTPGAPEIDFIFTVCDNAADEMCPIWPGKPISAHWGIADPAAVEGPDQKEAFLTAMSHLRTRIQSLVALPLESMDAPTIRSRLREIGASVGATRVSEPN